MLEKRLIVILFLLVLLPSLVIGWMAYGLSIGHIKEDNIKIVGRVADIRHEQLKIILTRANSRADAFLKMQLGACFVAGKPDHRCATGLLHYFMEIEGASGALVYRRGASGGMMVGTPAVSIGEIADFQPEQLARFTPYHDGKDRFYYVIAADQKTQLQLVVTYPVSVIQSIFVVHPDLGQSGETFLADGDGFFITKSRYPSAQGHSHPISARPMEACMRHQNAEVLDEDYRAEPIIHGFRFIPEIGGGCIMAHVDQAEAFAPVYALQKKTSFAILLFIMAAISVAFWLGRVIVRPVKILTKTAVDIAEGHLDQRVKRLNDDEVGRLAVAFNSMADNLVHTQHELEQQRANLEKTVEQRTGELQQEVEEHKLAEAKLSKYMVELENSNRELDDFAYVASHDLKEPLRGIHNYASYLQEDYSDKLDAEGRNHIERMQRLVERQIALIDRLFAYSRIGRTELVVELVDIENVLDNVAEDMTLFLESQQVELRRVTSLPKIMCNPVRVGEVFQNLIVNGSKYNDKSGKWVEVGCDTSENIPVFYVRDNGIGIAPQHQESVFRIFKRIHEQNKYGGGTGAGLTIVKKIVERHGGRIWLESVPGVGTTFYFTLNGEA